MKAILNDFLFDSDFDSANLMAVSQAPPLSPLAFNPLIPSRDSTQTSLKDFKVSNSNSKLSIEAVESKLSAATLFEAADEPIASQCSTSTFYLRTKHDGIDSGRKSKNRCWFHFSVQLGPPTGIPKPTSYQKRETCVTAEFNILDLNRVQKLFNMGMRPVFRHSDDTIWRRIPTIPITQLTADKGGMNMKFQFTFSRNNDTLMSSAGAVGTIQNPARAGKYYFAYCRPYSYTDCQNKIESIEKSLKSNSGIYFHRSVLCESSDGRNLDLLTITSNDGMSDGQEPLIPGLFPNLTETCALFRMSDDAASSKNLAGSPRRKNKSYFFLTARVHPGETISSYILDGFIDYLVSADKGAALLRSLFVFKIIPMLNPDGVYRGHYRGDADGVNLNRAYQNATPDLYPTIWATKHYISTLHEECGPVEWFIDLHGHANKPGCFMFGNWIFDLRKQYDMHLFAKCMLNNSTLFDLNECEFAPKEMIRPSTSRGYPSNQGPEMECTKDGTSRVGIFKAIGIHHCYTFEANYHGTRADKRIPRNDDSVEWKKGVRDNRFTLGDIHGMGKSIALAVADFCSPKRGGSFFRNDSAISVAQKWAAEQLKQMYHTAMVPIDEVQLKSSRLC